MTDYDIVILGGGTSGTIAAIQAGREGTKVLLVEKNGQLGGTMTSGGVNFPGLFHAWGNQVISGIGWELVSGCVKEDGETLPDFKKSYAHKHWLHQVAVNPYLYACLASEKVMQAGVHLMLHTMIADIIDKGIVKEVILCTKQGLQKVKTRIIIDCTGDANAVSLAGYEVNVSNPCQPLSMQFKLSGYDYTSLDIQKIADSFDTFVIQGKLQYLYTGTGSNNIDLFLQNKGVNLNHIPGINGRNSDGKTKAEEEGRHLVLKLYRFLKFQPGLEHIKIDFLASECGIRETVRIVGKTTITAEDYLTGRIWEDSLCYAFYPLDPHSDDGDGYKAEPLSLGVVPTIPRSALLPEKSRNFIVAGRCVSSDRLANSALRVQGSCMAMGQAAGVMAALSIHTGMDVENLEISEIHRLLKKHKAIVPLEKLNNSIDWE